MNMNGTYIFSQNGKEIARQENIITEYGRKAILNYLIRPDNDWSSSFAVGAINTQPTYYDKELAFELYRSNVTIKSYSLGVDNILTIKGSLPEVLQANIYEIGLFPQATQSDINDRNNFSIVDFSSIEQWQTKLVNGATGGVTINNFQPQVSTSPRVGQHSVTINPSALSSTGADTIFGIYSLNMDLSKFTNADYLKVLCRDASTIDSTPTGNFQIIFTDINGESVIASETIAGINSDYQAISIRVPDGLTSLSAISSIELYVDSQTTITIDAVKISTTTELSELYYLSSRAILSTPIPKAYGSPLDIEYQVKVM